MLGAALAGGVLASLYSSTRLLSRSLTKTLPDASTPTARGLHTKFALTAVLLLHFRSAKSVPAEPWPNTRSAVVSPLPGTIVVVRGVLNSTTRLFAASA